MSVGKRERPFIAWLVSLQRSAWAPLAVSVLLTVLMVAFGRASRLDRVAMIFFTNTIIAFSIGIAVTFGFGVVLPKLRREGGAPAGRMLLEGVVIAVATVVGTEIAVRAVALVAPSAHFLRLDVLKVALPVTFTTTIITLALGRAKDQRRAASARSELAERELLRAELVALKARVQPHFLFNSLNTVAGLIEEDPRAAERALLELSALFRYTLDASLKASVPLGEEIEAARRYLRFEQLRFEERLRVVIDVPAEAEVVRVPPLLLQPLVENAVVHGVSSRKESGRVALTVRVHEGTIEIAVDDDGPGPNASLSAGSRTASRDLERRLALSYGGDARLETGRGALGGFSARLVLPMSGPREAATTMPAEEEVE